MISEEKARRIASEWHGGKSSPLYAFSSSGTILDGLDYEIARSLDATTLATDMHELSALLEYVKEHKPMSGLYRTEIFLPGCLNDGDEWFATQTDAIAYADEWGSAGLPYHRDGSYDYAPGRPLGGVQSYSMGWIDNGADDDGKVPVSYRITISHYPTYAFCTECTYLDQELSPGSGIYDTTERDECDDCGLRQVASHDAQNRE